MSRLPGPLLPTVLALFALSAIAHGQTATETVLANLNYNSGAGLIQAADGNFYGTGYNNFSNGGVVFKMTPAGTVTYLYTFQGGADGGIPQGPPVQGPDGTLYGVAKAGGTYGFGVIYNVNPTTGAETAIYSFTGGADGGEPAGALIFDNSGNLYGATTLYGADNFGTAYKFNVSAGTLTVLHPFCSMSNCADGTSPAAGLVQGTDANLYGTALTGGAYGDGTFYKLTTGGAFSLLDSFCATDTNTCPEGFAPASTLAEGRDGNFYGSNQQGGAETLGTIFKATVGGSVTPVYTFTGSTDGSVPDGPVFGSDGNLYGATELGGLTQDCDAHGCGSVFKVTTTGSFTLLYDFTDSDADANPYAGPMQGSDGNLYGTTSGFKTNEEGAVYKLALSPALAAPVQLTLSQASIAAGNPVTLSWLALNTYSMTLQQCYAYVQGSPTGAGTWTGLQPGTYNSSTHIYSGSAVITPASPGTFVYALTCGGVESGFATLIVGSGGGKLASAAVLAATPNPISVGQTVALKATVTGSGATPTGNVAFVYAGATLATVPLNGSGVANLTASSNGYPPGDYPITAEYAGNSTYNSAKSTVLNVTLDAAPTSTTVTASPNPVTPPSAVTLTATIKRSAAGAAGTPGGKVTFSVGTTTIGTATLSAGGVASLTAPSKGIAAGTYTVTAKYTGDTSDSASSSTVKVTVN